MKRLYFLSVFLLIHGLLPLEAGDRIGSSLNLSLFDGSNMVVTFDQQTFEPTRDFFLDGIRPGRHVMKVQKRRRNGFDRTVFHGSIDIERNTEVVAEIDPMNRLRIVESFSNTPQFTNYNPGRHSYGNGRGHRNNGGSYGYSRFNNGYWYGSDNRFQRHNRDRYGQRPRKQVRHGHRHTGWWDASCRFNHLHPQDFRALKQTVSSQWFDRTKAEVAMEAIRRNHISAEQLRDLLFLMDFESTRLRVAKFAYRHTCDTQRFFVVYDAFEFDNSVRELNRFTARL